MSFYYYPDLPAELRTQIRAIAIQDLCSTQKERWLGTATIGYERQPGEPTLAPLACVNQEWKEDVEKHLFEKIHLHECPVCAGWRHGELETFDRLLVGARRSYLGKVKLDFSRCDTICHRSCAMAKAGARKAVAAWWHDDGLFDAIHQLLNILKQWDPREAHNRRLSVDFKVVGTFLEDTTTHDLEHISRLWPTGVARDLTALPSVPFIDVSFASVYVFTIIKSSTLLEIYNTLPNLRTISFDDELFDWDPPKLLDFINKIKGK